MPTTTSLQHLTSFYMPHELNAQLTAAAARLHIPKRDLLIHALRNLLAELPAAVPAETAP